MPKLKQENFEEILKLPLADSEFFKPRTINVVLGKQIADYMNLGETMDERGYEIIKTKLGFLVSSFIIDEKET